MPDKVITAKTVDLKTTDSGKKYELVTDGEGIRYSLWDKHMEAGLAYHIEFEVSGDKGYKKIKSFDAVKDKLPPPSPFDDPPARHNGDCKNRCMALSYAKDLAVARIAKGGEEVKPSQIIGVAEMFRKWLDGESTGKEV